MFNPILLSLYLNFHKNCDYSHIRSVIRICIQLNVWDTLVMSVRSSITCYKIVRTPYKGCTCMRMSSIRWEMCSCRLRRHLLTKCSRQESKRVGMLKRHLYRTEGIIGCVHSANTTHCLEDNYGFLRKTHVTFVFNKDPTDRLNALMNWVANSIMITHLTCMFFF